MNSYLSTPVDAIRSDLPVLQTFARIVHYCTFPTKRLRYLRYPITSSHLKFKKLNLIETNACACSRKKKKIYIYIRLSDVNTVKDYDGLPPLKKKRRKIKSLE